MRRVSVREHCFMTTHSVKLAAGVIAALTVVTVAAGKPDSLGPSVAPQSLGGAQPEALADGKRLYEANCANCHGPHAQGATKAGTEISIIAERGGKQPPDLTDQAWDHGATDTAIFTVIKQGIPLGMMPPYEGRLSDVDIRNVVAYVRSLSSSQAVTTAAAPAPATPRAAAPVPERTLEVADYVELPVTGDMNPTASPGCWRGAASCAMNRAAEGSSSTT